LRFQLNKYRPEDDGLTAAIAFLLLACVFIGLMLFR
jgi:hypothetical protein